MFEAVTLCDVRVGAEPVVNIAALQELRALLEAGHDDGVLQLRHPSVDEIAAHARATKVMSAARYVSADRATSSSSQARRFDRPRSQANATCSRRACELTTFGDSSP